MWESMTATLALPDEQVMPMLVSLPSPLVLCW